jgi:2-amino-4-hydroxy-6-hydroxymethyldihydropteridine diphosphokinase
MSAFVSFGSNIEPERNIPRALSLLAERVRVAAVSTVYLTPAEGPPGQPPFANGVVRVETRLDPRELKFRVLRRVEAALGRVRSEDRFAPRTIDLDLILYDDLVTQTEDLTLPDPDIAHRAYLAVPLCELNPDLRLPGTDSFLKDLAAAVGRRTLKPLADLSRLLKETYHGLE